MISKNLNHSKMPLRKLSRLNFGTAWLLGWVLLAAWIGFGREWMQQTPTPAMASVSQAKRLTPTTQLVAMTLKVEAVAISSMKVGDQVPADNPTGEHDDEFGDTVDPPSWRKLVLLAPKKDGSFADVELLRPLTWLEEQQAEVGGSVDIHVPECGIEGRAEVLAIEPCPTFKHDRRFRIVTGTFKHQASKVLDVYVEGLDEPIGTTPNHPFWSEDRQTFVRADELKEGEHLRAFNGTPIVRRIVPLADPEPVFNLEVQCDHVYHVAKNGVLVHNSNPCPLDIALGLGGNLRGFQQALGPRVASFLDGFRGLGGNSSSTWRQITTAMDNAQIIHFNLEGISKSQFRKWLKDRVVGPQGTYTNAELFRVLTNQNLLEKTTFYIGSGSGRRIISGQMLADWIL